MGTTMTTRMKRTTAVDEHTASKGIDCLIGQEKEEGNGDLGDDIVEECGDEEAVAERIPSGIFDGGGALEGRDEGDNNALLVLHEILE